MAWLLPAWPALPRLHVVAVMGAESTGKSTLLGALQQRLQAHGVHHAVVPETLRAWCETQQRLPRAEEQAAIAHRHAQAILAAAAKLVATAPPASDTPQSTAVLLVDTSPLTTALYSQHHFDDDSGLSACLAFERGFQQRLLLGLDLPWTPEPGVRDGPAHQQAFDQRLRQTLQLAQLPHQVIYGLGARRAQAAWVALQSGLQAKRSQARTPASAWRAACDCCADPACEWALFSRLSQTP